VDFHQQQGDSFPIAAREQVERTVTYNPVSSSAPSNLTPDHPVPQHVSTAPATYSDTTIAPNDLSSASPVDNTIQPVIPNVTSLADAIQAPVSDLNPEVTSTDAPAARVNHAAPPGDVTANPLELSGPKQAFDHQAQHHLEASISDGSTLSIVGIDVHHTATALA
jgi:hypothetical protein